MIPRLEAQVQKARNELEAQRSQVLGELVQKLGGRLKGEFDRLRQVQTELEDEIRQTRENAINIAKRATEYRTTSVEAERLQDRIGRVNEGLERLRLASALTQPNITVVQYPPVPSEKSEPQLFLYIPAVILFSLVIGLGLTLGIEFMDTRLRTPAEVERQVGLPLLGSVPDLTEDEQLPLNTDVMLVSYSHPHSLLAESFRQLRTSLAFASDQPVRTLLVTSPGPADGKSTVAANLAMAMARGGNRVLLVEANFRRPVLGGVFDVPDSVGLTNVLVGLNSVDEAIQATRIGNLDVVPGGGMPPSPADLLGSESMARFLQEQADRYDRIIIDGAPLLVVTDNLLLAEMVDGVVMVLRANENKRGPAQRAARVIYDLNAHFLGAVLNAVRATAGGYFRQAYQAYYDYAGDRTQAREMVEPAARTGPAATPDAAPEGRPGEETNGMPDDALEDLAMGLEDEVPEPEPESEPPTESDGRDRRET
jgi:capsular exopolysaccharide synthesis family protein